MKKLFSIGVLFLVISSTAFSFGTRERNKQYKMASNAAEIEVLHDGVQSQPEAAVAKAKFDVSGWPDDPLLFMRKLTGHENIIKVYGNSNVTKLKELLNKVSSGESDSSGRRYFSYSADLRPAPPSSMQQKLDTEIAVDRAAREINQEVSAVVDLQYTIRSYDGKMYQDYTYQEAVKLTRDIMLIGRNAEEILRFVVDKGNKTYGYGIFYVISAIPIDSKDSDLFRIMSAVKGKNQNAVMSILLERTPEKTAKIED